MHAETLRGGGRSNYRLQDIQLSFDASVERSLTARRQKASQDCLGRLAFAPRGAPVGTPPHSGWPAEARAARGVGTPDSKFAGGHRSRDTPVPIPNTEVKPATADGTAWETVWESRSLPGLNQTKPAA